MHRHKSFSSTGEIGEYMRGAGPAHCYHSAAYYGNPGAPTMDGKDWHGADLIFDMDADHLPNRPESWPGQLEAVKDETKRLMEFLLGDLGIDEGDIQLVFSGGRGYHLHVRDPRSIELGAAERRELVDYVAGRLQPGHFIKSRVLQETDHSGRTLDGWDDGTSQRRGKTGKGKGRKALDGRAQGWIIHGVMESGSINWPSRISSFIAGKLIEWEKLPHDELKNELKKYISTGIEQSIKDVKRVAQSPEKLNLIKENGIIDLGKNFGNLLNEMVKQTVEEFRVEAGGKPDEPVTADLHRLIRLPGSLHGGSSMLCMPLTIDGLDDFQPLRDAIAFGDEPVSVTVLKESVVEIGKKRYRVSAGAGELPQHLAAYLMCRGVAEYGP